MIEISSWIIAPCLTGGIIVSVWILGSTRLDRSIETPQYKILEIKKGYEIREYQSYVVAKTETDGSYAKSTTHGFRIIADYIFGNNMSRSSRIVQGTASMGSQEESEPVPSEKIPMTAPVISERIAGVVKDGKYIVSFVMPSKYSMETLPVPRDGRIEISRVEKHLAAAIVFSGYASEKRVQSKRQELRSALDRDNIRAKPGFKVAQYNPPSTFPLMRRNEVIIDLLDDAGMTENYRS